MLGGCASSGETPRSRMVAPNGVGTVYSEVELQAQLALASDAASCSGDACAERAAFWRQVHRVGTRLSQSAYREYPELKKRVYNFYFSVPPKDEIGTLSSASGSVVVLDGVRGLAAEEPALAFILAREMGHVIAEHHEENSATSLLVSAAAALLLPMANLIRGAAAAIPATAATGAATTAASVAGSRAIKSLYRPEQNREADAIGLALAVQAGYRVEEVAAAMAALAPRLKDEGWMGELLASAGYLDAVVAGPPTPAPVISVADCRDAAATDSRPEPRC